METEEPPLAPRGFPALGKIIDGRSGQSQPPLTVDDAISRPQELVVTRRAPLGVYRDLLVGGKGGGELDSEVGHLTHDDLLQVHAAGR